MSYGVGGLSRSDSEKSVRACQAASWLGAVQIGLESGRDLPAVPVGDEPHPGARNRVDHTGGDRGLGPGLPAFASGRPVSPSHSPARFALKREVPPLRSDTPRRCGCASTNAHEPPFKEAPSPGPGPRYLSHVLDTVHAPPRPRCGPSGRRPGEQARTIGPDRVEVDHWEEDSSSGRVLPHARQPRLPRRRVLEMVPALSARAERGGQVVLDIPDVSIPPAHQAW